jgi:hypothetical protein
LFESGRRWRRNIFGLTTVIVLISGSAAAIYHRAWEWAMPLEGTHGPARLATGKPVLFRGFGYPWLAAVLPDGRLWVEHGFSEPRATLMGGYFVPGSNWVDAVTLAGEMVGIRSDGTLWVSEKPRQDQMVRFGEETDWQSAAREWSSTAVLLKRNGTLWRWGTTNSIKNYQGLRGFTPQRVGTDSDWARIVHGNRSVFAWKQNGDAWVLHLPERDENWGDMRLPVFDHLQFQNFSWWTPEVGLRDDGTLWSHQNWWGPFWGTLLDSRVHGSKAAVTDLVQIGNGSKWAAVAGGGQLLTLKTDGSIWKWNLFKGRRMIGPHQAAPERLGTHNDWVGLGNWMNHSIALAADGTLWIWPATDVPKGWGDNDSEGWLAPSRRPAKIGNIFDAKE